MKVKGQKLFRLFQNQLRQTLAFAKEDHLTFQQLYVVLYEAKVKLVNYTETERLKQYFGEGNIPLRQVYNLFTPISYEIIHNVPTFLVKIAKTDLGHRPQQCFEWWKFYMGNKYGNQLRWFDSIAMQPQCRRTKSFIFKQNMRMLLENTQHKDCVESICLRFPKNTKNQIQWSTFMAVIRHNPNKYEKVRTKSMTPLFSKVGERAKTEYNPEKTLGIWSQCSFEKPMLGSTSRTRCQTPSTIKISSLKKIKNTRIPKENKSSQANIKLRFTSLKNRYMEDARKYRLSTEIIHNNSEIYL